MYLLFIAVESTPKTLDSPIIVQISNGTTRQTRPQGLPTFTFERVRVRCDCNGVTSEMIVRHVAFERAASHVAQKTSLHSSSSFVCFLSTSSTPPPCNFLPPTPLSKIYQFPRLYRIARH
jgi:hypothetical protein